MTRISLLAGAAALGLAGCTDPDGTTNQTGAVAAIGGALGAVAGAAIGGDDNRGRNAVIGGVAGAAIGAGIGSVLDRQEAELNAAIGGSGARIINTGSQLIVSLPEAITFDIESAVVKPNSVANITAIARNLQDFPNSAVQVIGHTDNTGTEAFNQDLSVRRASAVSNILISNGVNPGRVAVIGQGERAPIASNATPAGREQNRRVEIVITPTT